MLSGLQDAPPAEKVQVHRAPQHAFGEIIHPAMVAANESRTISCSGQSTFAA